MTAELKAIWRFPIKGIGAERLERVDLAANAPLPGDRAWALLHDNAPDTDEWQPRRNYLVVASGPQLAAIKAVTGKDGRITLTHPDRPPLTIAPETDGEALKQWVQPIWPAERPQPQRLAKAPPQGMADNGQAQVSLLSLSSLRALSQKLNHPLTPERFRGNLVVDGLAPWEEFDLIGKTIRIGNATLHVTDRIERCRATEANTETGKRDCNPLRALEDGWNHRDFGVYATVTQGGQIATGDQVTL